MDALTNRCRDCNAPVLWTLTLAGKRQPLDASSDPIRGDTFIAAADHGERLAIHVSRLDQEAKFKAFEQGLRLYRSHFQTCRVKKQQRKVAA